MLNTRSRGATSTSNGFAAVRANGVIKSEILQDNYSVQDIFGVSSVIISKIWYDIFRLQRESRFMIDRQILHCLVDCADAPRIPAR